MIRLKISYLAIAMVLMLSPSVLFSLDLDAYPTVSYTPLTVQSETAGIEVSGAVFRVAPFGYYQNQPHTMVRSLVNRGEKIEASMTVSVELLLRGESTDRDRYAFEYIPDDQSDPVGWRGYRDEELNALLERTGVSTNISSAASGGRVRCLIEWSNTPRLRLSYRELTNELNESDFFDEIIEPIEVNVDGIKLITPDSVDIASSPESDGILVSFKLGYVTGIESNERIDIVTKFPRNEAFLGERRDGYKSQWFALSMADKPESLHLLTPQKISIDDGKELGRIGDLLLHSVTQSKDAQRYIIEDSRRSWVDASFTMMGGGGTRVARAPVRTEPIAVVEPYVQGLRSSSFLQGTATVLTKDAEQGIIWYQSTYAPESLFDGVPGNAWVEAVEGPGTGEWVEFRLTQSVIGLTVHNGIQMYPPDENINFEGTQRGRDYYRSIYEKNNRVKHLSVRSIDHGARHTIELDDSREAQHFNDLYFPAGTYRIVIESVYTGSTWDDTCLGELSFGPATPEVFFREGSWFREALTLLGTLNPVLSQN